MINVLQFYLIEHSFSFLLRLFPSFSTLLHAMKKCIAPRSINAYTRKEFNYSIPTSTFGEAMRSSCVM